MLQEWNLGVYSFCCVGLYVRRRVCLLQKKINLGHIIWAVEDGDYIWHAYSTNESLSNHIKVNGIVSQVHNAIDLDVMWQGLITVTFTPTIANLESVAAVALVFFFKHIFFLIVRGWGAGGGGG